MAFSISTFSDGAIGDWHWNFCATQSPGEAHPNRFLLEVTSDEIPLESSSTISSRLFYFGFPGWIGWHLSGSLPADGWLVLRSISIKRRVDERPLSLSWPFSFLNFLFLLKLLVNLLVLALSFAVVGFGVLSVLFPLFFLLIRFPSAFFFFYSFGTRLFSISSLVGRRWPQNGGAGTKWPTIQRVKRIDFGRSFTSVCRG